MPAPRAQPEPQIVSPRWRRIARLVVISGALLALAASIAVPFIFESASLLYKSGWKRLFLLASQVLAMVAGYLLLLQVILGARIRHLDRIFGLNNLYRVHRVGGLLLAGLALLHPVLLFISDDRRFIPFQWRYWPEFVGLFVLLLILGTVLTANWRARLGIPFHRWWPIHRIAAVLIMTGFVLHLLFASETFQQDIPQLIAYGAMVAAAAAFLHIWTAALKGRQSHFSLASIEPVAKDALRLTLVPEDGETPVHAPGQFAFLSFYSDSLSDEEHPFTIASAPTRASTWEFVVRTTGDWTSQLARLQIGDKARVSGPFGLFSHLNYPHSDEMIMIAGGIGITPMLSMLSYMADTGDHRRILLIWSNRSGDHIPASEELHQIESELDGLRVEHVLTREAGHGSEPRRLDRDRLQRALAGWSTSAIAWVCGPDQMIKQVSDHLRSLGYHPKRIISERFHL